jgi:hypothetical protein
MAKFVKIGEHILDLDRVVSTKVFEDGKRKVVTVRLETGLDIIFADDDHAQHGTIFLELLRKHADITFTA